MSTRRRALPGADELFRSTGPLGTAPAAPAAPAAEPVLTAAPEPRDDDPAEAPTALTPTAVRQVRRRPRSTGERRPSGRERHDEKITVYVSAEELMDLEHARLALRGDHGLAVDRGRIVREALAVVIADLEAKGESSILVRRLTGR